MDNPVQMRTLQDGSRGWLDAWQLVSENRYSIAGIVAAAVVLSAVVAWVMTPIYRAEAAVTEVADSSLKGSGLGELAGLANLAGVELGGRSEDSAERLAVLRSRALVDEFIKREDLVNVLLPEGSSRRRTAWFAGKKFRDKVLEIKDDPRAGVITVIIEWKDPGTAARWANSFVALANEVIRRRDARTAERNIAFLNQQMNKTTVVELRKVLYNLIEAETKTLMLASTRDDYAFAIVDPAVAPELKAKPARLLIVVLGAVFGVAFSVLIAVMRRTVRAHGRSGGPPSV